MQPGKNLTKKPTPLPYRFNKIFLSWTLNIKACKTFRWLILSCKNFEFSKLFLLSILETLKKVQRSMIFDKFFQWNYKKILLKRVYFQNSIITGCSSLIISVHKHINLITHVINQTFHNLSFSWNCFQKWWYSLKFGWKFRWNSGFLNSEIFWFFSFFKLW